jgi:hypothetical protein
MDDLEIETAAPDPMANEAEPNNLTQDASGVRRNPFRSNPFNGWERQRLITFWIRVALVGISTIIAIKVVQPSLVFKDTTPTGGDMGAHVWGPAYLRDHLLPWKLNGWSMDWYSGFPIYRFYMVVPALFIVFLNFIFPYGVAFKIVAVAGIAVSYTHLTLPTSP